jgi:cysteine desulfurase
MHANNETGVIQPVDEIAEVLSGHPAYFHVDAAQGFGKDIKTLQNSRIDLLSISAHKIYGPKGVGALVVRRRGYSRPPLTPLLFGGGQERGLRPGTLPVPLIAGFGLAAELAVSHARDRAAICVAFRKKIMEVFRPLHPIINGDQTRTLPHVLNFAIPGIDSEALIVTLKNVIAISNGSACTSHSYQPSHVLRAMELPDDIVQGAVRLSWCHMTEEPEWGEVLEAIELIR